MKTNHIVNLEGFSCSMLIIKTKKALDELQSGEVLELHTADKGSINDLKAWTKSVGHELLKIEEEDGKLTFWIKKA
ncbi:sulfurtransferase TusA family protein [Massilibacterium senegalense]|uniref:sulfurtransferase TusA family protein n=1 Tax=Massilibacterium senegalense TaxID=1632858 RepID=UPI00093D2C5C|nr:sulfurtransferase TusA family protein [Massilibacterium senegalense]